MDEYLIEKAEFDDLQKILKLQYLVFQTEAELFGNSDIPPLKQTLDEVVLEYRKDVVVKIKNGSNIIGLVKACEKDGTVFVGKLMVRPNFRRRGLGRKLLLEIENVFMRRRYELFTSTRSVSFCFVSA